MKFAFCFSLLFALSLLAYSQNQPQRTEEYCEIEVEYRLGSPLCYIRVDFGQFPGRGLLRLVDRLRDPMTQQPLEFNSPIDALNYMNGQGWELMQVYSSDSCDARYIMRRSLVNSTSYNVAPR